jgi:hypothetical protein
MTPSDPETPVPPGYDPELPFFLAHREMVRTQAEQAQRRRRLARRRPALARALSRGVRPLRRASSLAGVLALIGATAWAVTTHSRGADPTRATVPRTFSTGTVGSDHWSLSAWHRAGELCRGLSVDFDIQSECLLAPVAREVQILTARSPTRVYVSGLTRARVVRVRIGGRLVRLLTHPGGSRGMAAGLGGRLRWFLTSIPRSDISSGSRVSVTAVSSGTRSIGRKR